jgi:Big-like domain-containing protein
MVTLSPSKTKHRRARRAGLLVASVALVLPSTLVAGALLGSPVASAAEILSQTFNYNDTTQYFTVPAGVELLDLTASGGQGGSGTFAAAGGDATQIAETVAVTPGDTLVVEVGGAGGNAGSTGSGGTGGLSSGDGMNGGAGGAANYLVDGGPGGGGGGGTEVVDATANRVLVAAAGGGGGGGEDGLSDSDGGVGGQGGTGSAVYPGADGTSRYGAGGAGGPGGISGSAAGNNGGTPQQSTTSGAGGGGGGGYDVAPRYGGGGDGGAGGGWSAYQSGGGGGGGGASYTPPYAFNVQPATSTGDGQVTLSWTAAPTATTTSVGFAPGSVVVGQSYTVSATVTGTAGIAPTGPVQFSSNGSVVGTATLNGGSPDVATWTATAPEAPGSVSWQAQYLGDTGAPGDPGDTASTSPTATVMVTKATTTTSISLSPDPTTVGAPTALTVTVTGTGPVAPTGAVEYDVNGAPQGMADLSGGTPDLAEFTVGVVATGNWTYSAQYLGDTADDASASAPVVESAGLGSVAMSLSVSPVQVAPGKPYTVTAFVTGFVLNPTGQVRFESATGQAADVTLVPQPGDATSVATYQATAPRTPGSVDWQVAYEGDGNYGLGFGSAVETVQKGKGAPPTVVSSTPPDGTPGTTVTITGTHLTGVTKVLFGTKAGTKVKCPNATTCTAVAPTGQSGTVSIYVVTSHGTKVANEDVNFHYVIP